MKNLRLTLLAAGLVALNIVGCSGQNGALNLGGKNGSFLHEFQQNNGLTILDADMKPLANAKVMIGNALGQPFDGNMLTTNESGQIALPAGWTTAQPVTIDAPGFIRATYFAQDPGDHTYRLRRKQTGTQYAVQGTTQGHPVVDFDGLIDFGLVMPALTRYDLLSFNMDTVISPQSDTISIVGQDIDIPINVTLPHQKESYFIPITIEKPNYHLYFGETGMHKVFAGRGRFPFKEVAGKMRNKVPFYQLVNEFTVMGGTIKDVEVGRGGLNLNINVNDMTFNEKTSVVAPHIPGDECMMAVSMFDSAGYLIPTDVKRFVDSGSRMQLSTYSQNPMVLAVMKRNADLENSDAPGADRLSAALVPAKGKAAPQFLPMIGNPSLAANGDVLIPKINTINGVNALATYGILSQIQSVSRGEFKVQINNSYWEMYAPQWATELSLPKWPAMDEFSGKKHLEVNLIGSVSASQVDLGPAMLKDATHVTHSSMDF